MDDPRYNSVNTRLAELLNEIHSLGGTTEYNKVGDFVIRFPEKKTKLIVWYSSGKGWTT